LNTIDLKWQILFEDSPDKEHYPVGTVLRQYPTETHPTGGWKYNHTMSSISPIYGTFAECCPYAPEFRTGDMTFYIGDFRVGESFERIE